MRQLEDEFDVVYKKFRRRAKDINWREVIPDFQEGNIMQLINIDMPALLAKHFSDASMRSLGVITLAMIGGNLPQSHCESIVCRKPYHDGRQDFAGRPDVGVTGPVTDEPRLHGRCKKAARPTVSWRDAGQAPHVV